MDSAASVSASGDPTDAWAHAIGQPRDALNTPALLVDLDRMARNIARMRQAIVVDHQLAWRPHVKSVRAPGVALALVDAGAIGVTCAKLGEAEVMAAAGIRDILIANQIVGERKIARLMDLLSRADVAVSVDSLVNVDALDRAARARGLQVRVVIEVDVGMRRAGVAPGAETLAFAGAIVGRAGVRLAGLMTFEAHALDVAEPDAKRRTIADALGQLVASADLCRRAGIPIEIVSCGGTGTYPDAVRVAGVTEIQAGGGVFSDLHYQRDYGVAHELALTVLATVTSRPNPTRVVCDVGRKALTLYGVPPEPVGMSGVRSLALAAEHTTIELDAPSELPRIGDKLELATGHVDFTVHLHDELFGMRDGNVQVVWPIPPRREFR